MSKRTTENKREVAPQSQFYWDEQAQEAAFQAIAQSDEQLRKMIPKTRKHVRIGRTFADWGPLLEKAVELGHATTTQAILESLEHAHDGVRELAAQMLVKAVKGRQKDCVRVLLRHGQDGRAQVPWPRWETKGTRLLWVKAVEAALVNDDAQGLRWIIETPGAPENALCEEHPFATLKASVLVRAVQLWSPNCVHYLAPIGHPNTVFEQGTALICAAHAFKMNGEIQSIVESLLAVSDASLTDPQGMTALMWAVERGNVEMVKRLLPVSDPVSMVWPSGRNCLEKALFLNNEKALACAEELAQCMREDDVQKALDSEGLSWGLLPKAHAMFEHAKLAQDVRVEGLFRPQSRRL